MLQYPINVYPDKTAFDTDNTTGADYFKGIKFTFQGDVLSAVFWRVCDYATGEVVLQDKSFDSQIMPLCYNNGEMEISNIFSELPYGKYILQMMLTETRTTQTEGVYKRVNSHDRYISRGKITSAYSTDDNNSIMIEDKINIIYPWGKVSHMYFPNVVDGSGFTFRASEVVMHIGNEVVPIDSYNSLTGQVYLSQALLNDYPVGAFQGT